MPTLLVKATGNKYINRTMFKPTLLVYDEYVTFRKRKYFFWVDEMSMPYGQVTQVNLYKGIIFSRLEIITWGDTEAIVLKGVWNKKAREAKRIIDQKIHQVHAREHDKHDGFHGFLTKGASPDPLIEVEHIINRLRELLHKKKISAKEFEKKKAELLKRIK